MARWLGHWAPPAGDSEVPSLPTEKIHSYIYPVHLLGRGVFDKTHRTAFQRPRNHVVLHRFRKGQVGKFGENPGSATEARRSL